jgi:heme-degrading monooxygenase HmoA
MTRRATTLLALAAAALGAAGAMAASAAQKPVLFIVQLESELAHEDVVAIMRQRAPEFRAIKGLKQKHYLHDAPNQRYAGVYEFKSQADLEAYLRSDLRKTIGQAYKVKGLPSTQSWEVLLRLRE